MMTIQEKLVPISELYIECSDIIVDIIIASIECVNLIH